MSASLCVRSVAAPRRHPQTRTTSNRVVRASATMGDDAARSRFNLCYFPVLAKGLPVALVASHSGLAWGGQPEGFSWRDAKETVAPFKQMPLMFVDGQTEPVAQSTAIAATIGRMADGADDVRQYSRSMMLMAEAEDLYTAMQKGSPTKYVPLGERGKTAETHAELWGEVIPKHVGCLEALLGDADAFTSTGWLVGELFLWGMVHQIVLCKSDVFAAAPNLQRWYDRILSHPKTAHVLDGTSPMGVMEQYFVNP